MLVTINTDASYHPQHKVGAYFSLVKNLNPVTIVNNNPIIIIAIPAFFILLKFKL